MTEVTVPGKPLGRRLNHDPRSLSYTIEAQGSVASAEWSRKVLIFNQGNTGSCTGNASAGVLGTEPFFGMLHGVTINEDLAVRIYSAATALDPFEGFYPPDDTGSDGNSAAKAVRNMGYISGWQHITSLGAAHTAIQSGPFITGVNWYAGFDTPDENGVVSIHGEVRGGHEFEIVGYNADTKMWKAANSWGSDWGVEGYFFFSDDDYARLLAESGDATTFTALVVSPTPDPEPDTPTPEPTPTPTPTPTPDPSDDFPKDVVLKWLHKKHYTGREDRAADAIEKWMQEKDLL